MLKCEKCGETFIVEEPEFYQQCEECGGKLIETDPKEKLEVKNEQLIRY